MGVKKQRVLLSIPPLLQQFTRPVAALALVGGDGKDLYALHCSQRPANLHLVRSVLPGNADAEALRVTGLGKKIGDGRKELRIAVRRDLHVDALTHLITPPGGAQQCADSSTGVGGRCRRYSAPW